MSTIASAPQPTAAARIGPNTIIQVAAVLRDRLSPIFADAVLHDATRYSLSCLPTAMIDEREAQGVVQALVRRLGASAAVPVLREAGVRTADYLLERRIPRLAQFVIRVLPRRAGLRLLLKAMHANAWTFAGSGHFRSTATGHVPALMFEECAMCRDMHQSIPMCDFYAGTFERLLRALIHGDARVVEVSCMAQGASSCRFELHGV